MLVAEVFRAGAYISRFSRHACQVYTATETLYRDRNLLVNAFPCIKVQLLALREGYYV
jgi:hypothetical protein